MWPCIHLHPPAPSAHYTPTVPALCLSPDGTMTMLLLFLLLGHNSSRHLHTGTFFFSSWFKCFFTERLSQMAEQFLSLFLFFFFLMCGTIFLKISYSCDYLFITCFIPTQGPHLCYFSKHLAQRRYLMTSQNELIFCRLNSWAIESCIYILIF